MPLGAVHVVRLAAAGLGLGSGAELQQPLAIAVIGGLSMSTIVTLVFVPAMMSVLPGQKT
jgi:HAE1 family hydrophobic/amphiphilic exporter-1